MCRSTKSFKSGYGQKMFDKWCGRNRTTDGRVSGKCFCNQENMRLKLSNNKWVVVCSKTKRSMKECQKRIIFESLNNN